MSFDFDPLRIVVSPVPDHTTPNRNRAGSRRKSEPAIGGAGRWTKDEDGRLRAAVAALGAKNWKRVSIEYLASQRSDVQCLHRWNKVLKPGLVKGPWTAGEDKIIRTCILQGISKWSEIAANVPGRIGKQCRERWFNHLDPSIKKGDWSEQEDLILCKSQAQIGNKWCDIAKLLPGRSENAVKNRWNSATRRRQQEEGIYGDQPKAESNNTKQEDKQRPDIRIKVEWGQERKGTNKYPTLSKVQANSGHEEILAKLFKTSPPKEAVSVTGGKHIIPRQCVLSKEFAQQEADRVDLFQFVSFSAVERDILQRAASAPPGGASVDQRRASVESRQGGGSAGQQIDGEGLQWSIPSQGSVSMEELDVEHIFELPHGRCGLMGGMGKCKIKEERKMKMEPGDSSMDSLKSLEVSLDELASGGLTAASLEPHPIGIAAGM
jgi:hypothetical protein